MMNNRLSKKNIMPTRNVAALFFITAFVLVFFIESSTAMVCFCGRCFPSASQDIEIMIKAVSYKGSSNNNIRICKSEKGKTLKGVHFPRQVHDSKILFASIINSLINISSVTQAANNNKLFHDYKMVQSFSICLKTLSIRC